MTYSDWKPTKVENPNFKCISCGGNYIHYRIYEDNEGHEDYEYQCQACKIRWIVEGSSAPIGDMPAVVWQYRYRKTIGSIPLMSDWRECSEKDAKEYRADFEYGPESLEVRELCVRPVAALSAPRERQEEKK